MLPSVRRGIIEHMKLRPSKPEILNHPDGFARMIEGLLRSVDRVIERPRRKTAKVRSSELISKSA